jgi:hypothetical protein
LRKLLLGDGSDAEISDDDSDAGGRPIKDDFFLGSQGEDGENDESDDSHGEDEREDSNRKSKATRVPEAEGAMTYTYIPSGGSKSGAGDNGTLEGVRALFNMSSICGRLIPYAALRLF